MESLIWISMVFAAVFTVGTSAVAAEETERSGFWAGVDVGAGYVDRSVDGFSSANTDFYLGLKAGYAFHPQLLTGIELSGWNQQATDREDPTRGEGLRQLFLINRFYFSRDSNLFAKVGGGWVRQWAKNPSSNTPLDGWGAMAGIGYDFSIDENWAVTPFLNYSFGTTEEQKHQAITLGVGITFY